MPDHHLAAAAAQRRDGQANGDHAKTAPGCNGPQLDGAIQRRRQHLLRRTSIIVSSSEAFSLQHFHGVLGLI